MLVDLRLRPLCLQDEQAARTAHGELDDYDFLLDLREGEPWDDFVDRMRRQRLPQHRRRGRANEILRQSIVVSRSEGVDDVLVTCAVGNVGSRLVIERCGGVFDGRVHDHREGVDKRRYWIR